jgi:hypothetical protein
VPPQTAEIRREVQARKAQPRAGDRKRAFLAAYAICASVKAAAVASGVPRSRHYDWLKTDADYHARFRGEAREQANQALEDEATERAITGVYEPNVFQGRFVYPQHEVEITPAVKDRAGRIVEPAKTEWRDVPGAAPVGVWKKSDFLLALLIRGAMPEKYRPGIHVEVPSVHAGPISLTEQNLRALTDDELATLKRLAEKLAASHDDRGGSDTPDA